MTIVVHCRKRIKINVMAQMDLNCSSNPTFQSVVLKGLNFYIELEFRRIGCVSWQNILSQKRATTQSIFLDDLQLKFDLYLAMFYPSVNFE